MKKLKLILLGSGNVATAYARRLQHSSDIEVTKVYSRHLEHAQQLILELGLAARAVDKLEELELDADVYLFALSDAVQLKVWQEMPKTQGLWVHTTGMLSLEDMQCYHRAAAVVYPLQSLKRETSMAVEIPLLWEGEQGAVLDSLLEALSLERRDPILEIGSEQRKRYHLAAVFSSNFTNHLYELAYELLRGESFSMLLPLIRETAERLDGTKPPQLYQTGPAVREDFDTIDEHIGMLRSSEDLAKMQLYIEFTRDIITTKKKRTKKDE